jgi:hypothetical protein
MMLQCHLLAEVRPHGATLGRATLIEGEVRDLVVSPHVLTPGQSLLRKDTTEESEYAGLAWRRVVPPVAFVPRGVDMKRDHSPTPNQFRSRPRASLTLLMRPEGVAMLRLANSPMFKFHTKLWKAGAKKARSDRRLYQDL